MAAVPAVSRVAGMRGVIFVHLMALVLPVACGCSVPMGCAVLPGRWMLMSGVLVVLHGMP